MRASAPKAEIMQRVVEARTEWLMQRCIAEAVRRVTSQANLYRRVRTAFHRLIAMTSGLQTTHPTASLLRYVYSTRPLIFQKEWLRALALGTRRSTYQ